MLLYLIWNPATFAQLGESKNKIWVDKNDFILYYGLDAVLVCEIQNSEIKVHINSE